jgi:hypothetical protein
MEWFDKNIRKPIDLFSHPVWFIIRDKEVTCPCCDVASKQPDPNCHICLGTGNKITLARVKASHQNNKISFRGTGIGFSETNIVNVYYTHQKTDIKESDIIVDGDSVDVVKDVYYEHSDEQKIVYWRIETVPYKKNPEDFKNNLSDVLKEAGF